MATSGQKSPAGKRGRRVISFERSSSSQSNDTTMVAGNCSTLQGRCPMVKAARVVR